MSDESKWEEILRRKAANAAAARMAGHLPECSWIEPIDHGDGSYTAALCICDRLRACEARKDAEHADCRCNELEAMAMRNGRYVSIAIDGQVLEPRDLVLQEARDAVAALRLDDYAADALAAIDKLKGTP